MARLRKADAMRQRYWTCASCICSFTGDGIQLSNRRVCHWCYVSQRRVWLTSFARNLAVAAALARAFELGHSTGYHDGNGTLDQYDWWPGRGRRAP